MDPARQRASPRLLPRLRAVQTPERVKPRGDGPSLVQTQSIFRLLCTFGCDGDAEIERVCVNCSVSQLSCVIDSGSSRVSLCQKLCELLSVYCVLLRFCFSLGASRVCRAPGARGPGPLETSSSSSSPLETERESGIISPHHVCVSFLCARERCVIHARPRARVCAVCVRERLTYGIVTQ